MSRVVEIWFELKGDGVETERYGVGVSVSGDLEDIKAKLEGQHDDARQFTHELIDMVFDMAKEEEDSENA